MAKFSGKNIDKETTARSTKSLSTENDQIINNGISLGGFGIGRTSSPGPQDKRGCTSV